MSRSSDHEELDLQSNYESASVLRGNSGGGGGSGAGGPNGSAGPRNRHLAALRNELAIDNGSATGLSPGRASER